MTSTRKIIFIVAAFYFYSATINETSAQTQQTSVSPKETYKLSGGELVNLSEKLLYKKTPQADLFLYLLRPSIKGGKALPAIIYFTGGGWVNGSVEDQIPNAAWFRDHGIIGITAD